MCTFVQKVIKILISVQLDYIILNASVFLQKYSSILLIKYVQGGNTIKRGVLMKFWPCGADL